jgi:hypothetical protein
MALLIVTCKVLQAIERSPGMGVSRWEVAQAGVAIAPEKLFPEGLDNPSRLLVVSVQHTCNIPTDRLFFVALFRRPSFTFPLQVLHSSIFHTYRPTRKSIHEIPIHHTPTQPAASAI